MRELSIPTRKTNPIHNDVPENITFLLLDQPSGEEKTRGTLISKIEEVAINAKTANWKAIVIFIILQANNKRTIPFIPLSVKKKALWWDCTMSTLILYDSTPFTLYRYRDLGPLLHKSRLMAFYSTINSYSIRRNKEIIK